MLKKEKQQTFKDDKSAKSEKIKMGKWRISNFD
jgi:hypothetical protein